MYDLPARIMTNPPHKRHQCCARPPRKQRKRPADKPVRAHSPPSADTNLQNDQIHVPMPAPPWQTPPFHSEKCSTHNGKPAPIPYTQKQRASASTKRATRSKNTSAVHTKTAGVCPLFCCRRSRRDDALLMFGRKSALPSATHLCRDVSQKSALRLAAIAYAGTYPESQPCA